MSIHQIMKSETIICTVPDKRKAQAVKDCFEGEISPQHPASILRKHPGAFVYLDEAAASLLTSGGEDSP
jgi:glucosamine-6-phosphate deaminase